MSASGAGGFPVAGAAMTAEHEPRPLREVTMNELDRRASAVVGEVCEGRIAVVTRHGLPVAVVLSLEDAVTMLPSEVILSEDALELADSFERRRFRRKVSSLVHSRYWE